MPKASAPKAPWVEVWESLPHLTEQLWENLGYKKSIFTASWPVFKPELSQKQTLILPIQINSKLRDQLELDVSKLSDENYLWQRVLEREKVKTKLNGKKIRQKIRGVRLTSRRSWANRISRKN